MNDRDKKLREALIAELARELLISFSSLQFHDDRAEEVVGACFKVARMFHEIKDSNSNIAEGG